MSDVSAASVGPAGGTTMSPLTGGGNTVVTPTPVANPGKPVPWKALLSSMEWTVLTAIGTFLGSLQFAGGSFDGKHLAAAGIGALTAFGYQMIGILRTLNN